MALTPNWGIPYAAPTDFATDYPVEIDEPRAMLLDQAFTIIDNFGLTGKRLVVASAVPGVSGSGGATIAFPAGSFAAAPVVVAAIGDEHGNIGYIQTVHSSITAADFAVRVVGRDGTNWTTGGNIRVNYCAVGAAGSAMFGDLFPEAGPGEGIRPEATPR